MLLSVIMVACEDDLKRCDQSIAARFKIGFYQKIAGKETDTALQTLTLYPIGLPDSIYSKESGIRKALLPLSPLADSTRFYIRPDTLSLADTLTVRYKRKPTFISPGCGYTTFFNLDTVLFTRHSIDSLKMIFKQVTLYNGENIKVYY